MRDELVAIDLETTGLDPKQDAIIEIGAVRMKDGEIIDEFSTMVNPDSPIPPNTTFITGIRQQDVADAAKIDKILPQVVEFVGSAPIIAHNTALDMGFLKDRHHILKPNLSIDTYDLASVLVPNAPRYNLNSLTQQFDIHLENAHRALDDARATALLYWALWHKTLELPHSTLEEICRAAKHVDWDTGQVFLAALRHSTTSSHDQAQTDIRFTPLASTKPALSPVEARRDVDLEQLSAMFGEQGDLANAIDHYEARPQQMEMVHAVAKALNESRHLIVEADTGTGKSLAYLAPAVLWATQNQQRVVVSTNTINLQDQLIQKDIPLLKNLIKSDFNASVMKGRSNYLCPRRLAATRRRPPTSVVEVRTLAKILVWLLESQSGDRNELNLRGPVENNVWQRLSAADEACTLHRCESVMGGGCPFYKARKKAETAHILIVNHALLLADTQSDNRVLPDYQYVIVDEAHHLEDATTSSLSTHIDKTQITRRLDDLSAAENGLLSTLLTQLKGHTPPQDFAKLQAFVQGIGEAVTMMKSHVDKLFEKLRDALHEIRPPRGFEFVSVVRIDKPQRKKNAFIEAQSVWQALEEFFEVVASSIRRLKKAVNRIAPGQESTLTDLILSIDTAAAFLQDMRQDLNTFMVMPDSKQVTWLSMGKGATEPVIHIAPLHIGAMIEEQLWNQKTSAILTSATLRTQGTFDFLKDRLFAESVDTLEVGSPFNYQDSTLLYLPNDIAEPADRHEYQRGIERGIIELTDALDGRVMVLFTSFTHLRQTSQNVAPRLALGNIEIFDQSDGTSRQALLEGFMNSPRGILMGTRSFWEGIDIPGEALSALIITRLPFAVPSDPIFASRSDSYKDSFNDYALPEAILRFRQGFGRLIRTQTDRGIVTVFDRRILSKSYGSAFIASLPDCTVQEGPLSDLATNAKKWLNQDT